MLVSRVPTVPYRFFEVVICDTMCTHMHADAVGIWSDLLGGVQLGKNTISYSNQPRDAGIPRARKENETTCSVQRRNVRAINYTILKTSLALDPKIFQGVWHTTTLKQ